MNIKDILKLPQEAVNHIKQLEAKLVLAQKIVAEVKGELPRLKEIADSAIKELPAIQQIAADIEAFES